MQTSYCHDITTLGKVIGKDQGPSSPMNAINKRDAVIYFLRIMKLTYGVSGWRREGGGVEGSRVM